MFNQPPSPILLNDDEHILKSLIGLSPTKRIPKKMRLPSTSQKKSLEGVLHQLSKCRLYDKIVSTIHRDDPRIQTHYNKLMHNMNPSTINAKRKNRVRNQVMSREQHAVSVCQTGRLSRKLSSIRPKGLTFSKEALPKKQNTTLPLMKSISLKDQDINPKDKRIQDLFIKIAKREAGQFVYDISFPKRMLLDYITQEFSPKFSSYFNWFMELRATIDYYYYVSLGNRFLKMDIYKIAHFTYSAFDGFSFENSLEIFMHNYGSADLMMIIENREGFKDSERSNQFQKKTLTQLQEQKNIARTHRTVLKSNTLYRRTFQFRELNTIEDTQKKQPKQQSKKGQISFKQFCQFYSQRVPNIYKQLLKKLYFIDMVDSEKGTTIDRRAQSYNRERNGTRQQQSHFSLKNKQKKKQKWFGL